MSAPLLAQNAAPRQPVDQNAAPQQPADQNHETAPRQESGPSVSENAAPDLGPETVRATAEATRRYMEIAARGGWPRLAHPPHPGANGSEVARLRRRLAAESYLSEDAAGRSEWDEGLTDAIKRFQANHGLDQTGDVSRATLRALNVPAAARAKQLEATARRLARLHFHFPRSYVEVNIPAASVEAVEDGKAVRRFTAIVGGKRHKSPQITAKIVSVDINPTWTVPASIIKKEMEPRVRRDPNYLARQHIRVFDGRGHEVDPRKLRRLSARRAAQFTFRQDPGPKNALGSLRLSMPNKDDVYMHDTPQKTAIRSRLPLPVARLCARGRSLRSRGVDFERLGHGVRAVGQREAAKRDRKRADRENTACASDAGGLGLFDRLGRTGRHGAVPSRYLRP